MGNGWVGGLSRERVGFQGLVELFKGFSLAWWVFGVLVMLLHRIA